MVPAADARPADSASRSRGVLARGLVHLGLLASIAGALATLTILYIRNAIHADIGLVFVGLVVLHLWQRRHTVVRLTASLGRAWSSAERAARLAGSDLLLAVLTLNVLLSGLLDWSRGEPTLLPLVPRPFDRWHFLSGVALVVYLAVHVWHRRGRLVRSAIR